MRPSALQADDSVSNPAARTTLPLQEIVEGIRMQDRASEELLVETFGRQVFGLIAVRIGDRDEAEDLCQQAMMEAIEALRKGQLREPERLPAYLASIARNVVADRIRKRMQFRSTELDESSVPAVVLDQHAERDERERLVHRALSELDATDRRILLMTLMEGEKPGKIAETLGMNSIVVRQRKCRAIQRVADFVRQHLEAMPLVRKRSSNP